MNGRLVYIGKSSNILHRMAEHYAKIYYPTGAEYKYTILNEACKRKVRIRFHILYRAKSKDKQQLIEEIGEQEGTFIRRYHPVLNTQIPYEDNWR